MRNIQRGGNAISIFVNLAVVLAIVVLGVAITVLTSRAATLTSEGPMLGRSTEKRLMAPAVIANINANRTAEDAAGFLVTKLIAPQVLLLSRYACPAGRTGPRHAEIDRYRTDHPGSCR